MAGAAPGVTARRDRSWLRRYAALSIAAALVTMGLKGAAFALTGSVGMLSDAVESGVNLAGAVLALAVLTIAARPADAGHTFGHSKAEYFSSIVEGLLVLLAALAILWTALGRVLDPQPLEHVGLGLLALTAAAAVNLVVARTLTAAGRQHDSITLEADGQHLMTDVWTSAGVILGVGLVRLTGWAVLDPLVAAAVAVHIAVIGYHLVARSVAGLMDAAVPAEEQAALERVMRAYRARRVDFHALRTRQAGSRRFITVHMLVPGDWTVHDAHHVAEDFEGDVRLALGDAIVTTHLEPIEDEISMSDVHEGTV